MLSLAHLLFVKLGFSHYATYSALSVGPARSPPRGTLRKGVLFALTCAARAPVKRTPNYLPLPCRRGLIHFPDKRHRPLLPHDYKNSSPSSPEPSLLPYTGTLVLRFSKTKGIKNLSTRLHMWALGGTQKIGHGSYVALGRNQKLKRNYRCGFGFRIQNKVGGCF